MIIKTMDASFVRKCFLAGANAIDAKKEVINDLNVFPVPDGDTGTNMTMTIMSAAKEVAALENPDMKSLGKAISGGSLRGARGNSGVILSQLLRGFTKEVSKVDEVDVDVLTKAFERAVESAYKAVMKPKEGTILTVARGGADKALELNGRTDNIAEFMNSVIMHMRDVLDQTPKLLPVLKEAGVVDSGGEGLVTVLEGAYTALIGKEVKIDVEPAATSVKKPSMGADAGVVAEADIKFGYCTEFIIMLEKPFGRKEEIEFKAFLECEAMALAEIKGEYVRKKTAAQIFGAYVDHWFEGTLDLFAEEYPEAYTRNGDLKKEFQQANFVIERTARDKLFMKYMSGKKQVIKTGTIEGVPFKIKMDSYHPGKAIVDLKVVRSFEPIWKQGYGRLSFIEAWGYDIQGAIYQAVEKNRLPFYIAAVTKEREPDLAVIQIIQSRLDLAMEVVMDHVKRFQAIKEGKIEPVRCEKCDYCRRTKVLKNILSMEDFE